MKHAYLIIANRNINQLQTLLDLLDDSRNDIFLMIDKKSQINENLLSTKHSNLNLTKRIDIYWGDYSLIQAEIDLFDKAYNSENDYSYYHLISGMDLPLQSQDYIHSFYDNNPNMEFFTLSDMVSQKELEKRMGKYYFHHHFRTKNVFFKAINKLQKLFYSLSASNSNDYIYFGSQWCSVDDEFVGFLLENKNEIYEKYSKGFIVDELYKVNLLMNNDYFRKKIFYAEPVHNKPNDFQGNLRYINWWDGSPKVWKIDDYEELEKAKEQGYLFSRKFDDTVDSNIIKKIFYMVNNEETQK